MSLTVPMWLLKETGLSDIPKPEGGIYTNAAKIQSENTEVVLISLYDQYRLSLQKEILKEEVTCDINDISKDFNDYIE